MANGLPSLCHTTGNETWSGEKEFTSPISVARSGWDSIKIKNTSIDIASAGAWNVITGLSFYAINDGTEMNIARYTIATDGDGNPRTVIQMRRMVDGEVKYGEINLKVLSNGTSFASAPTTPSDATSNEIVTANWYRMKNLTSLNLGDATHKFKKLAKATISGSWQHIITTIEAHKYHNTIVTGNGSGLLRISLSTDGSGVIGSVGARWLENDQNLEQFHVLYDSDTVEIWMYNTDSAVLHQYDYWLLRLRECFSRVGTDRKSMWDFTSEFADALPEGMTEVEIASPITVTPSDSADNSKKIANTAWVNTASMVVHTVNAESICGLKTFKDPIHLVNDSVSYTQSQDASTWTYLRGVEFRDKASERMGEIRSVRYTNTVGVLVNSTEIIARGKDNIDTLLAIVTADDGQKYAYCPSTPSNATNNIIATADWVNNKLAGKVTISTSAPTPTDGNDGDIWIQY